MKNKDLNEKLYDLINGKNYSELSADEKSFLNSENITEEKFFALQKAENYSSKYFNELPDEIPDDKILKNITAKIPKKSAYSFISKKFPAYYSFAASLLVFIMSWTLFTKLQTNHITVKEKIVYDTIYMSNLNEMIKSEVNITSKESTTNDSPETNKEDISAKRNSKDSSSRKAVNYAQNEYIGLKNVSLVENQPKGRSLSEDTVLSKLRFTMQSDITNVSVERRF